MNQQLAAAPVGDLPRLLFKFPAPVDIADDINRAIATAGSRWPPLQAPLEGASRLVRAQSVFEAAVESPELALVRLPVGWSFRAVYPTPTGLACTCGGCPPAMRVGPGDGLYCADILTYLLAL